MKISLCLMTVVGVLLLGISGCSMYPFKELAKAEGAVMQAKATGAPSNCPDMFVAAEEKLAEAKEAADIPKDYPLARMLAGEAEYLANSAKLCMPPVSKEGVK